jgi:hypothetical protein
MTNGKSYPVIPKKWLNRIFNGKLYELEEAEYNAVDYIVDGWKVSIYQSLHQGDTENPYYYVLNFSTYKAPVIEVMDAFKEYLKSENFNGALFVKLKHQSSMTSFSFGKRGDKFINIKEELEKHGFKIGFLVDFYIMYGKSHYVNPIYIDENGVSLVKLDSKRYSLSEIPELSEELTRERIEMIKVRERLIDKFREVAKFAEYNEEMNVLNVFKKAVKLHVYKENDVYIFQFPMRDDFKTLEELEKEALKKVDKFIKKNRLEELF